jgi:hypothetical protein
LDEAVKRVTAGFVVVVLVAVSVVALRWRSQYQPLTAGNEAVSVGDRIRDGVLHPGGEIQGESWISSDFRDATDSSSDDDDDDTRHVVTDYVDGQHVVFAYSLHNAGRVAVTITGFARPAKYSLLAPIDIRVGTVRHNQPFHSFRLGSGQTRDIVVRQRMHACEWTQPGSSVSYEGLDLTYRVFGLHHATSIKAPLRVEVKVPDDYKCPRTRPGHFEGGGLAFDFDRSWHAQRFDEPHLVTYVSTEPLHEPCADNSCTDPINALHRDGVLIAWYDGPKGRVANENLRVDGVPAHKTVWHHGCTGLHGDEGVTVRFDNRARTATYTMNACLRGPDLAYLRGRVDAMLRSVQFV